MRKPQTLLNTTFHQKFEQKVEDLHGMMIEVKGQLIMFMCQTCLHKLDDIVESQRTGYLQWLSMLICTHIFLQTAKTFLNMRGT